MPLQDDRTVACLGCESFDPTTEDVVNADVNFAAEDYPECDFPVNDLQDGEC